MNWRKVYGEEYGKLFYTIQEKEDPPEHCQKKFEHAVSEGMKHD
jgi:hypothetical protein